MRRGDFRLIAARIDDNDRGHPTEEIAELAEDPEPDGLIVGVADRRIKVRKQRIRKIVSGVSLLEAIDWFRNDRDDLGGTFVKLLDTICEGLHLTAAVRTVLTSSSP